MCMQGDSYKERRSSGHRHAKPSQRSPRLTGNSCLVGLGTSSHTAMWIDIKDT